MMIEKKTLREAFSHLFEKVTAKKPFEEYLFGDARGLDEPDVDDEGDLADSFNDYFDGSGEMPAHQIALLKKLRSQGTYTDVLNVPDKYQYAWRIIEVDDGVWKIPPAFVPKSMWGRKIKLTVLDDVIDLPLFKNKPNSVESWTVDPKAIAAMGEEDIYEDKKLLVIFQVDLSSQRNAFMCNPDELSGLNEDYGWQQEIWQVEKVTCNKRIIVSKENFSDDILTYLG